MDKNSCDKGGRGVILETNYHRTLICIRVEDRIVKGIKRQSSERNENGIVSLLKHAALDITKRVRLPYRTASHTVWKPKKVTR